MNSRLFHVLSQKSFLFLFLAEVFSQIAWNMANFILILLAFELSNSNTAVSGIVLSFTVPAVLFGVMAGTMVDNWNKKSVLFAANIIRAVLLLILAFVHSDLLLLYIISFLIAFVTQFFIPAETPMIPLLIGKKSLFSANALFGLGLYGSILVAFALSSPFLFVFGKTNVFIVLSLFFILASFFVSLIKEPHKEKVLAGESFNLTFKDEISNLFAILSKTKDISHSLFLLALSQIIILILAVVGPGYVKEVLHLNIEAVPLILLTPGILGVMVGALILGNYFHSFSKQKMANIGVLLMGIMLFILPAGSRFASRHFVHTINLYLPRLLTVNILHIMVVFSFLMGVANAFVFVPSNALLQEKTSDKFRGKVYGVLNTLVGIFSLFPVILVGGLADLFGAGSVLRGIGVILLIIGAFRVIFKYYE